MARELLLTFMTAVAAFIVLPAKGDIVIGFTLALLLASLIIKGNISPDGIPSEEINGRFIVEAVTSVLTSMR
jgi:hypothetical protein